jgi:hypothetical protein
MLFKTRSAAVYGIEAYLVDVEVNISTGGNGQVVIVGLPDTAVRESKNDPTGVASAVRRLSRCPRTVSRQTRHRGGNGWRPQHAYVVDTSQPVGF